MPKDIIVRSMSQICTNAVSEDVRLDAWPSDLLVRWDRVVMRDLQTANTRMEILLVRGGETYYLASGLPGAVGYTFPLVGPVYAPGDFRLVGRFVGATAGDTLELFAYGEAVSE